MFIDDLENKVKEMSNIHRDINMILNDCKKNISFLINSLKNKNFEESLMIFDKLFYIQSILSCIKYKYDFSFDEYLNDFIYFFDRDDEYNRKYLYNHFQKFNQFPKIT